MSKKPTPSKKQAVSATRTRKAAWERRQREKLENKVVLDTCPVTGEKKLRHFASPSGHYKGRTVFEKKSVGAPVQEIEA